MLLPSDKSAVVEKLLNGLNPRQKSAVIRPFDTHCLILAGAGCGKTSVLTKRIAFCAYTHCKQSRILALTFTRKASEEMQSRLMLLSGIDKNEPLPLVTTFHGFGRKILRDKVDNIKNIERVGYTIEPMLMSTEERLNILADISTIEQRRTLKMDIMTLDNMISQQMVCPEKIKGLSESSQMVLKEIYKRFSQIKLEMNYWEFSDMIAKTLNLFSDNPDIESYYAGRYDYILVDEFQDTNPLQISILKRLIKANNNLFAVGDDDQAIYGFRGADIGPIMHFKDHFQGAEIVKLETNYRSTPAILSFSNKVFKGKPLEYRKILQSGKYDRKEFGRKPSKHLFSNQNAMIQWIAKTAQNIEKEEGIPIAETALLFRINETLEYTKKYFINNIASLNIYPRFLTVHGSKGLEFPVVFLCDLEESVFPNYKMSKSLRIRSLSDLIKKLLIKLFIKKRQPEIECNFDEEKRLFYVGITRAEKFLFLLSVKSKYKNNRSVLLKPSRFLKLF